MTATALTRRHLIGTALAAPLVLGRPAAAAAGARVAVVGAGFAGASCARALRRIAPEIAVTLIEPEAQIVTCPFSNLVIAGMAEIGSVSHGLDGLRAAGIEVIADRAIGADAGKGTLTLAGGGEVGFDRLVVAPGIDLRFDAIAGYDAAAAEIMPHAWKAGAQTLLLRARLEAMADGGTVAIVVPANPYRCPPGPYERASLIAHYLKTNKPRSKLLVIDGKDTFSKQGLFLDGWAELYGPLVEWIPVSQAGSLLAVDPAKGEIVTEFSRFVVDVANIIPPQRAGALAQTLGLAGEGGWCSVDPVSFESLLVPGVHVLGDAIIAGAMPKSGFAASSQGKACAHALAAVLGGEAPQAPSFINTCYSLVGPEYGISVADVFRVGGSGKIEAVEGAGGTSPRDAGADVRRDEARYAHGWYASITADIWG
ncbi:MAG: FCSD flavin-binding domain-containing protein [Gemmobacter sp.]|jgi:sulfide dehydrogenase [flavocytochrome c] flavoprotein subunit